MFYILHTESGLSYYAIFALRAPILHVIKLEKKHMVADDWHVAFLYSSMSWHF